MNLWQDHTHKIYFLTSPLCWAVKKSGSPFKMKYTQHFKTQYFHFWLTENGWSELRVWVCAVPVSHDSRSRYIAVWAMRWRRVSLGSKRWPTVVVSVTTGSYWLLAVKGDWLRYLVYCVVTSANFLTCFFFLRCLTLAVEPFWGSAKVMSSKKYDKVWYYFVLLCLGKGCGLGKGLW